MTETMTIRVATAMQYRGLTYTDTGKSWDTWLPKGEYTVAGETTVRDRDGKDCPAVKIILAGYRKGRKTIDPQTWYVGRPTAARLGIVADTMTRAEKIDAIATASTERCPEIRPVFNLRHKVTGRIYSPWGLPYGINRDDCERCNEGFCIVVDNATVGTRFDTEAALRAHWQARQQKNADDFRAKLAGMDDTEIEAQAAYWLK